MAEPQDDKLQKARDLAKGYREAQPYIDAAWQFAGGILGGCFLGYFFDRLFHTKPWGFIGFFILGTIAGFVGLIRATSRLGRKGP